MRKIIIRQHKIYEAGSEGTPIVCPLFSTIDYICNIRCAWFNTYEVDNDKQFACCKRHTIGKII